MVIMYENLNILNKADQDPMTTLLLKSYPNNSLYLIYYALFKNITVMNTQRFGI